MNHTVCDGFCLGEGARGEEACNHPIIGCMGFNLNGYDHHMIMQAHAILYAV